jgi:hypothetical protein
MRTTPSQPAVRRHAPARGAVLLSLCLALLPLSDALALVVGQAAPEVVVTTADG